MQIVIFTICYNLQSAHPHTPRMMVHTQSRAEARQK